MKKYALLVLLSLVLGCSKTADKLQLPFQEVTEKLEDKPSDFEFPSVDILFVVDNSGSMQSHQSDLAKNIDKFLNAFSKVAGLDYHIGVLTTDMDSFGGDCCGRLVGRTKFVTAQTPNMISILRSNLMVGTSGSAWEKSFDPIQAALTQRIADGSNVGFYRPNAHLAVIFITDAEDQSDNVDADGLLNFLVNLKGNPERILGYGVLVPTGDNTCTRDDYSASPRRIEDFLSKVFNNKNNIMGLCDPDYGDKLSALSADLVRRVSKYIYLKRLPIESTIRVTYGNLRLPRHPTTGWVFDIEKNAIVLGEEIDWDSQPSGSKLKIYYESP